MAKKQKSRVGENNPMYGRHHSQISKQKMREARLKHYAKIKGIFAESHAIAYIIKKGMYDEYTTWVSELVSNEIKLE